MSLVNQLSFFTKYLLINKQITIKVKYIKTRNIIGILSDAFPVKESLFMPRASNQLVTGLLSLIQEPNIRVETAERTALFALAKARNPKNTFT